MRGRSLLALFFGAVVASAQTAVEAPVAEPSPMHSPTLVTDTLAVAGRCNHCKERIEKLVRELPGVQSAQWDRTSKLLTVTYDPEHVSRAQIQEKLAAGGHDTEEYTAPDEAYGKLPKCCRYRSP